jgi:hypothetical protein
MGCRISVSGSSRHICRRTVLLRRSRPGRRGAARLGLVANQSGTLLVAVAPCRPAGRGEPARGGEKGVNRGGSPPRGSESSRTVVAGSAPAGIPGDGKHLGLSKVLTVRAADRGRPRFAARCSGATRARSSALRTTMRCSAARCEWASVRSVAQADSWRCRPVATLPSGARSVSSGGRAVRSSGSRRNDGMR